MIITGNIWTLPGTLVLSALHVLFLSLNLNYMRKLLLSPFYTRGKRNMWLKNTEVSVFKLKLKSEAGYE